MIAVDANILVCAHREDSPWHEGAYAALAGLAEGKSAWAIPWPCKHEFIAIVTHPKIYLPPSPLAAAVDQVEAWLESPRLALLGEDDDYWSVLRETLTTSRIAGPRVHDARVAALCLAHGVSELWTADRDFSRFPSISVRNPLI